MYRIIIVDDEYWVGRWLMETLKDCGQDVEVCGVFQDSEEALQSLKKTPADLIITDINMPVVSGLELVRTVAASGRQDPKVIIISGYDEFEYAKQAIELNVVAYLMKPLQREEVFRAVAKAVDSLASRQRVCRSVRSGFHAAVENALTEYLQNPQESSRQKLRESMVPEAHGKGYAVGLIQNLRLEDSSLPREQLKEKLEMACGSHPVFLARRDPLTWGFLVGGIERAEGFYLEQQHLLQILRGYAFGLSRVHNDLNEMGQAVLEARDVIVRQSGQRGEGSTFYPMTEQAGNFIAAIGACDQARVAELTKMVEANFFEEPYNLTTCLNFYFILTGDVIKMLTDYYRVEKDERYLALINEGYEFSSRIQDFYSVSSICRKFGEYSLRVTDLLKEMGAMKVSDIVQKVQRLIQEQYASDLNLCGIAESYSINPSYFSKKFKEETGTNFVDYLAGVRIDHARSLLEHTRLPVARISEQVGFNDSKYFSKVFAAVTGLRPTEYRNQCGGEAE